MKKLVFSLIATVFMSVLSVNAQSAPKGFKKIDLGLGKISSYAGPCVTGPGTCSGGILDDSVMSEAFIAKTSENVVSLAFTRKFYEENQEYLKNGLTVVRHTLPQEVTSKLGFTGPFTAAGSTYEVTFKDNYYFVSLQRDK